MHCSNFSVILRVESIIVAPELKRELVCFHNVDRLFQEAFLTPFFNITAPPVFIKSPKNQTIPKGQTATFPCSATGDPTPSVSWYKSNSLVNTGANFVILSNGTLLVTRVTQLNSGWFTCQAENQAGTREVKAFLLVAGMKIFCIIMLKIFTAFPM